MFGCAFLLDETAASFEWLFKSFLESMGNKQRITIFTDQDQAMSNAMERVFPNTRHCLCQWHISKHAPSYFGESNTNSEFKYLFNKCLKCCDTELEFQQSLDKMIQKFNLKYHNWLNMLYKVRAKWSTAFTKDVFTGEIKASKRCESTNNVLNGIANKTISLTKFVIAFENVVAGMRSSEMNEDCQCKQGAPIKAMKKSEILDHASQVYTCKMFKVFEKEFLGSIAITWKEVVSSDSFSKFEIREEGSKKICIVHFTNECGSEVVVSCSCKKFGSLGILCCHTLRVLSINFFNRIPNQYILKRWTKEAKNGIMDYEEIVGSSISEKNSKVVWCNSLIRIASNSVYKGFDTEVARNICKKKILELEEEIEREIKKNKLEEDIDLRGKEVNQENDSNITPVLDPPHTKLKGLSNSRLKYYCEKRKVKSTKKATTSGKKKQPSQSAINYVDQWNMSPHVSMYSQNQSCTSVPFTTMLQSVDGYLI